ncbi:MAG: MFS transporter [Thermomicrobium sp.]|nr:MFS transporter [Thermomicrobium sp.]MDW8059069.1 MFS transporter [Thermomicrobium sp.]
MRQLIPRPWVLQEPVLRAVLGLTLLAGLVTGFVVPFLSLVARERGASYGTVGLMASAFLLAQLVFQFPAGALADRVGRAKPVVAGLVVEGLATAGFVWARSPEAFVLLRTLQGIGLALVYPAMRALIADLTPVERRGEAYAAFWGMLNVGWLLGPALGGALASLVGKVPLLLASGFGEVGLALPAYLAFRRFAAATGASRDDVAAGGFWPILGGGLVAAMLFAFAFEVPVGIFTGIWSIYLNELGASDFMLGLSYTAFSVTNLLTLPIGARLASRRPRWRRVVVLALLLGVTVCGYGIPSVATVLLLGAIEGALVGVLTPSVDAYLSSLAGPRYQGRVQGAYTTAGISGAALAALGSSILYAHGAWVPFVVAGATLLTLALPAALLMRRAERRPVEQPTAEPVLP